MTNTDTPTVKLLEATPDPERVVCKAARNDYMQGFVGSQSFEEIMEPVDGDTLDEKQANLVAHMLDRGHFGPTEHISATFAVEGISRACMAQITRHRHATFDIRSMRYVKYDEMAPGEAVVEIPELSDPGTPGRNASFSDEYTLATDDLILEERQRIYEQTIKYAFESYCELLDLGVAPEHARMVLPIGTKVNMVVTLNARMLMHLFDMRAAADAQAEIRSLSEQILGLSTEWCPLIFEYYRENLKGRKNRLSP